MTNFRSPETFRFPASLPRMDHLEAVRTNAAELYQLGALTLPEQRSFELHYFECEACAAELRLLAVIRANARAVAQFPLWV